jgi:hypothetical protein
MKTIFCPSCGAKGQSVESYCRFCGEWLPDIEALTNRKLFGKLTREQKIGKMRVLEAVSAGLSLTSAAIIISILAGGDMKILFLAAFCCILVAVYQVVNFYLGYKLQPRADQSRAENADEIKRIAEKRINALNAGETTDFVNGASVTENTTKNLEPIPREKNK